MKQLIVTISGFYNKSEVILWLLLFFVNSYFRVILDLFLY